MVTKRSSVLHAALLVGTLAIGLRAQEPARRVRSGIDLVAVDVTVIDRNGTPIRGLTPEDFTVEVDGLARRVASAAFVSSGEWTGGRSDDAGGAVSSNDQPSARRLVVIAVDHGSLPRGEGAPLTRAAADFLDSLGPADLVALAVLPGAGLSFTQDRPTIRTALAGIVGTRDHDVGARKMGFAEALGVVRGDRKMLDQVVRRECHEVAPFATQTRRPPGSEEGARATPNESRACELDIRAEARVLVRQEAAQARASFDALRDLLRALREIEGPKTLVLISQGMTADEFPSEEARLGELARAAQVTVYVVQPQSLAAEASQGWVSPTMSRDLELRAAGLEQFVSNAGGTLLKVAGAGRDQFDRIVREISGYYLLAFEAEAADRDGQPHRMRVSVGREGATVRARRTFVGERAEAGSPAAKSHVERLLRSPLAATALTLRVTHYVYGPSSGAELRLVVGAELGPAGAPIDEATLGFVLVDDTSRVVASGLESVRGPRHASTITARGGRYTLKIAAVDERGRGGSVERRIDAALHAAGDWRASDLMLADPAGPADEPLRPFVDEPAGDTLALYLELYGGRAKAFDGLTVSFDILESEGAHPVVEGARRLIRSDQEHTGVQAVLPIRQLPPGPYVARARVVSEGRDVAVVERAFRLLRPVAGAATTADVGPAAVVAPSGAPLKRPTFDPRRALQPDVLGFSLDQVLSATRPPRSLAVDSAIQQARSGRFDAALAVPADERERLAAGFLRGLALFANGERDAAAMQLREALRVSAEFVPAILYLGACYAAAGRDAEAVAAWQTALAVDADVAVTFELLGDALVRLDAGAEAVAVLEEARGKWPSNDRFAPLLAAAYVGIGRPGDALALLHPYLESHPRDLDALFLAIRLIAEGAAPAREPTEEDLGRLRRYAEAYQAAGGPQQAAVRQWLQVAERRRKREVAINPWASIPSSEAHADSSASVRSARSADRSARCARECPER